MLTLTLAETAVLVDGALSDMAVGDIRFSTVSSDTRRLQRGELFVALRGPRHDAHEHLAAAQAAGACAALVERRIAVSLPQIQVADTRLALGRLASAWRQHFQGPLIALTGSNGKTTVKEMIASILGVAGDRVLATLGNLNNDIGVPLTLLRLQPEHDYAVIEMGANHPGEIAYLTALVQPDIALITNAGPAHLEGFGDLAGVARAKGEIYQGLSDDGIAIVNADDAFAAYWREQIGARRMIDFSLQKKAAVCARLLEPSGGRFSLLLGGQELEVALPLLGVHNIYNALAAAAAAYAVGIAAEDIRQGLQTVRGVGGRLQTVSGPGNSRLIDDSYNANPASLAAALAWLCAQPGEHWLVLGDMAELGDTAAELHEQAGAGARAAGVQRLFALGPASRHAVHGFGDGARHFPDLAALNTALATALGADTVARTILVKGSRSMGMERVVQALRRGGG